MNQSLLTNDAVMKNMMKGKDDIQSAFDEQNERLNHSAVLRGGDQDSDGGNKKIQEKSIEWKPLQIGHHIYIGT